MQFMDDSLLPENQDPLVIQVAPYAPSFLPRDSDDIAVTMEDQVQKAVDCYNAGATVLHVHVREPDGKGSKRLEMFNEMLDRLRTAVPKMILQVGGSISFAPKDEGEAAKWLPRRHAPHAGRAEPEPDQVTIAINTNQMNVMELDHRRRCRGHVHGRARLRARLYRDVLRSRSRIREGASQAPRRRRHPAALHDRIDQGPGDGRAASSARASISAPTSSTGCHRRRPSTAPTRAT